MKLLYVGLLAFATTQVAPVERKPPSAMSLTKRVLCDGKWRGHGIPTGPTTLVTVAHVLEGCNVLGWDDNLGNRGTFIVLRREYKERDGRPIKDHALLLSDTHFSNWATIEKRTPRNGEILYCGLLLPGNSHVSTVSGPFIGIDSDGFYHSDMSSFPGSSGIPVMDAEGKIRAIDNGSYGSNLGRHIAWSTPIGKFFD